MPNSCGIIFRINLFFLTTSGFRPGWGGVCSGKVDTGKCGREGVPFWPLRITNDPFFI